MSNRNTTLITKNSNIVNRPLPSSLRIGEAIVNTADGIVFYSGSSLSTNEWTPYGPEPTFFEVGSNLYNLNIRNKITGYSGANGAGLVGKMLSGTTDGFVLADITDITSLDTYVTDILYDNNSNSITLNRNQGKTDLTVSIDSMSGLTITGDLNVEGTIETNTINADIILSGGTNLIDVIDTNSHYLSGASISYTNDVGTLTLNRNFSTPINVVGVNNNFLTGGTLNGSFIDFDSVNTSNAFSVDLSALDVNDTHLTGATYDNSLLTLKLNEGVPDITTIIDKVSGLTVSNLTSGRVVYVGSGGVLVDEDGFTYNDGTNLFTAPNISTSSTGSAIIGTGGLVIGSGGNSSTPGTGDVLIHGNLTVFGNAISASTSELYIEDKNIILNYNPTGSTAISSEGAGFTIQDGNGISDGDVTFEIRPMDSFSGIVVGETPDISEYTGPNGYENRAFVTQLNDLVIRSNNTTTPNGVRVLAEFDILDGGQY